MKSAFFGCACERSAFGAKDVDPVIASDATIPTLLQLPSSLTGRPRAVSSFDLNLIAGRQVAQALTGSRLTDYRQAEDSSAMWGSAASVEQAQFKAAYWIAVAARTSGKWSLALSAANVQKSAIFRMNIPGENTSTADIAQVFREAAATVGSADRGVYAILSSAADPERAVIQQGIAADTSITQRVIAPLAASGRDLLTPSSWSWRVWLAVIGGGLLVTATLTAPVWLSAGRRTATRALYRAEAAARSTPSQLRRSLRRIRRRRGMSA